MSSTILSKRWWSASLIRAIKTFFQCFISSIGVAVLLSDVDWVAVLSASALAAILSLATSLAGLPEVKMELEHDFTTKDKEE